MRVRGMDVCSRPIAIATASVVSWVSPSEHVTSPLSQSTLIVTYRI
jgi:hypothetical protein